MPSQQKRNCGLRLEKKCMGISSYEQSPIILPSVQPELTYTDYCTTIVNTLAQRRKTLDSALGQLATRALILTEIAMRLVETLRRGHKVLVAGNGGSAAQAQHFSAELVGRFKRERTPSQVISHWSSPESE